MLNVINFSEAVYPLIMLFLAALTFVLNISLAKKSNERFKRDEMDKKVDTDEFKDYKKDHEKVHEKEFETDKEFRDWMREEMKGLRDDVREIKK